MLRVATFSTPHHITLHALLTIMALNLFGYDDFFWPPPHPYAQLDHHGLVDVEKDENWMMMPVIPNLVRSDDMKLHTSSPGYEVHEADGKYIICVDLPGVKLADVSAQVENEGRTLRIFGSRQTASEDGSKTQTVKFLKRFAIGNHMDADHLTATLEDGVLTLTAPVKEKVKVPVHTIVITEGKTDEKKEE